MRVGQGPGKRGPCNALSSSDSINRRRDGAPTMGEVLHYCHCNAAATILVLPDLKTFTVGGWAACDIHAADAVRAEEARQPTGTRLVVKVLRHAIRYVDISGHAACGAAMMLGLQPAVCGRSPDHDGHPHVPAPFYCGEHGIVFENWDQVRDHGAGMKHNRQAWTRPPEAAADAAKSVQIPERPRCPRCERAVRLTTKGAIGRHDKGPFHRATCNASGRNYEAEVALLAEKGRQDA